MIRRVVSGRGVECLFFSANLLCVRIAILLLSPFLFSFLIITQDGNSGSSLPDLRLISDSCKQDKAGLSILLSTEPQIEAGSYYGQRLKVRTPNPTGRITAGAPSTTHRKLVTYPESLIKPLDLSYAPRRCPLLSDFTRAKTLLCCGARGEFSPWHRSNLDRSPLVGLDSRYGVQLNLKTTT